LACLTMKLKILRYFETSMTVRPTKQSHIPENLNLQQHCSENLKWYDKIWYDIWYDTIYIWYDIIYDMMIWYDIWYDMIWYDMIWYDIIRYDMIYDMIWYDIFNCNWVATRWQ
jgi:hypothetical protein